NMIFEVQDLAVASPATVSRCGMVYVEPQQLGWRPLRDSWIATLSTVLDDESRPHLLTLFEWLVDPCVVSAAAAPPPRGRSRADPYCTLLKDVVNKHLGLKFDNVFEPPQGSELERGDVAVLRNLLYCDFQVPAADPVKYDEVTDLPKLLSVVQDYLADYNAQNKSRMDLVLFLFAAEHICRISRIIKQPYGNALLVGVGGSGRQSLTRIATFMADYKLFTIEISKSYTVNEWRDDLKKVLRQAGGGAAPTVFLFSDTQLKVRV
ncbi:Dynein heavy chain 1, axonemal, partial [Tetrabaena socialis]